MIADRFRELRRRQGMTQQEFADLVGLSLMGICFIENSKRQPLAETIVRVCRATGESADWLLGLPEKEKT